MANAALSTERKWPAQRDSYIAMYEWLLDQGVSASKIVFSGTSAGGKYQVDHILAINSPLSAVLFIKAGMRELTNHLQK